jgi:hypothetical protein
MNWEYDTDFEWTTNMESKKHIQKLPIILLDLPQQILAQEQLLDASDFLVLFEGALDSI